MKHNTTTTRDIAAEIALYKARAKLYKAEMELNEDELIDGDHLNCVWYPSDTIIGSFKYRGCTLYIRPCGEVFVTGDDGDFEYKDRHGYGAYRNNDSNLRDRFKSDKAFLDAIDSGEVHFENNNWLEFSIVDDLGEELCEPDVADTEDVLKFYSDANALCAVIDSVLGDADQGDEENEVE